MPDPDSDGLLESSTATHLNYLTEIQNLKVQLMLALHLSVHALASRTRCHLSVLHQEYSYVFEPDLVLLERQSDLSHHTLP